MKKLLKYLLSVICISIVGGMITLFIGNYYDSQQRMEYEKEREEWFRQEEENKKGNKLERLKIWIKLEQLVNDNSEWEKFYNKQREYLFEKLDIGDDDTYKILMIEESSKREWIYQFVKENYHRNSEERKLLRKYNSLMPGADEFYQFKSDTPERLKRFDIYKKCLPDRLTFIQKQKPEESAFQVFVGMAILLSIISVVYLGLKE